MKVIYNRWIPFKGFIAINILGIIFVRRDTPAEYLTAHLKKRILRHEAIHTQQMSELLVIPFYLVYLVEWLVRLIICRNLERAYQTISFEQEAYKHQDEDEYIQMRRPYAFLRYYFSNH